MTRPGLIHELRWKNQRIVVRMGQHASGWWDAEVGIVDFGEMLSGTNDSISCETPERAWEFITERVMGVCKEKD